MDWQAHFAAALVFAAIGAFFLFVTPIPFWGWPALLGSVSQLMSAIRVFRKLPSE